MDHPGKFRVEMIHYKSAMQRIENSYKKISVRVSSISFAERRNARLTYRGKLARKMGIGRAEDIRRLHSR